jgi:S-formylglutathione hydrolase
VTKKDSWRCFDGTLTVFEHRSQACNCDMRFAVFSPPQAQSQRVPVLWYLSGLTCTWENVMTKAGLQRTAAELGLMVIAPDTSPRGDDVADDPAYDLGKGAGFYLTATQEPWSKHYRMDQYIVDELQRVIGENFPAADLARQGITGHSMGGHGALTLHLKHPQRSLPLRRCRGVRRRSLPISAAIAPRGRRMTRPSSCASNRRARTS